MGIDDFAIKKRHTYGTILVNHENNNIIDMIPSRDIGDVVNLLNKYPNLELITRDGSIPYKTAIETYNPKVIQVSDRFHLLKGLTDTVSKILRSILPSNIIIDEAKIENNIKSLKERYNLTKNDIESGVSFTAACDKNNMNYRMMKKLVSFNNDEIDEYFSDKEIEKKILKVNKKNEIIQTIKKEYENGKGYKTLAKEYNLDRRTIRKYVNANFLTTENLIRERTSECDKFNTTIVEMVKKGCKITEIYQVISQVGYKGKYGSIKHYVTKIKKNKAFNVKEYVTRKLIIQLLFKDRKEINQINRKTVLKTYEKYPLIKKMIELVKEFKSIICKYRKVKALNSWLEKAKKIKNDDLNSFVNGILRDKTAIENAILYKESNGVVEASVNKLKLKKRIMCGRSHFNLLKSKVIRLEFMT